MKTILVIDDAEVIQLITKSVLGHDFHMVEATDSDTGLMLAQNIVPDLILLDIMMPGNFDGLELLDIIKSDATLSHIPVILMTGHDFNGIASAIRHGAVSYFTKPFSVYQLAVAVKEALA